MEDLIYWIWLSLSCNPGGETFCKLITKYKTPFDIYSLTDSELLSSVGSRSRDYEALCNKDIEMAESIYNYCKAKNIGILTYADERFPKSLKEINAPPVLLYYRGVLPDFNRECLISVVGTRMLTGYGKTNTFRIAYDLAKSGAVIVSGMAKGIDGVALAAALAANKSTVAVMGSGIDVCYPPEHKRLAREIVKTGCVFTEFAPGTPPNRFNFPKRNRIIAALSAATVLMEGRENSGAVITARYAEKYNRRIYAFPGNVGNPNSQASSLLIRSGARLFTAADDIIRDFDKEIPARLNPFKLTDRVEYDMNEVLCDLEVSAITSAEDAERVVKRPKQKKKQADTEMKVSEPIINSNAENEPRESLMSIDRSALSVYKKIPINGDCSVDSLIDGDNSYPDVMKALIDLEIARLVKMLPGDRVKRNLK